MKEVKDSEALLFKTNFTTSPHHAGGCAARGASVRNRLEVNQRDRNDPHQLILSTCDAVNNWNIH